MESNDFLDYIKRLGYNADNLVALIDIATTNYDQFSVISEDNTFYFRLDNRSKMINIIATNRQIPNIPDAVFSEAFKVIKQLSH